MKFTAQECTKSWSGRKTWGCIFHRQSKNLSVLSCFPAALYEHLRLPGKLGISTTPHCSAAATPALLQSLLENRDCRKPQGPSGDLAALWLHFHYLSLPLRSFPTPGFGAPFHLCTGLGNRKAEYWTNVHLSEYKTPCFQLSTVLNKHFFPLIASGFYVAVKVIQ